LTVQLLRIQEGTWSVGTRDAAMHCLKAAVNHLPTAMIEENRRRTMVRMFGWEMILAALQVKNPCVKRKKHVKYLLTGGY
jgi:hypothetical protein